jgi:C1A family cysteine protease
MYVNAKDSFGNYESGILNDTRCRTSGNHFIALVGYGTNGSGVKYWYARNSWGTSYGLNGYVKIQRKGDNNIGICGSQSMTSYPVMA